MSRTRPAPHDIQTFSITAPADNQVLTYNGTGWANEVPPWFAIQYVGTNLFGPGTDPGGNSNTVYGSGAMTSNLLGGSNVAVGRDALATDQYAIGQMAIGNEALKTVATTTQSVTTTFAGDTVLIVTAGDTDFTLIGAPNNTPGTIFTATGAGTGTGTIASHYISYGGGNTAIGYQSLKATTTGYYNVAVGNFTLVTNTTGSSNVAVGLEVLLNNTTGGGNDAYGWQSLYHNTTGSSNTSIGDDTMWNNTTGSNNTVVGSMAGFNLTTGSNNTLIGGYQGTAGMAGNVVLSTGDGTVRLQHDGTNWTSATPISTTGLILPSTTSTVTLNGSVGTTGQVLTSAGAGATPTWSKPYVALSGDTMTGLLNGATSSMSMSTDAGATKGSFAAVSAGTGDANLAGMIFYADNYGIKLGVRADGYFGLGGWSRAAWSWYSDASGNMVAAGNVSAYSDSRLKENFRRIEHPFNILENLDGGMFTWKHGYKHTLVKAGKRDYGILADQVAEVMPEAVHDSIELGGETYQVVDYQKLIPVLIEAVKELKREIEELKK